MSNAPTEDPRLPYREISDEFLPPRDPVLGFIKIGGKEEKVRFARGTGRPWVAPTRYVDPARFEVTTREKKTQKVKGQGKASKEDFTVDLGYVRDVDFHAIERVGENPSSLRVMFLYPRWNQNLIAYLGAYGGGEWVCRGNGVDATDVKRGECKCPCPRLAQFSGEYKGEKPNDGVSYKVGDEWMNDGVHKCKPHGQLNVLLEDAEVFGGFWPFKTTSFESISNLIKSLRIFEDMFGRIDGIPLELRVMAATKQIPGGGTTTQPIVTLVLPRSMDTARQIAKSAADESRKYLPAGGELDETKYLAAVVSEMEEGAESYAGEFMPEAEELEAEEVLTEDGKVESEKPPVESDLHKCGKCGGVMDSAGVCWWCRRGRKPPSDQESGDGPSVQAGETREGSEPEVQDATPPPAPQPKGEAEEPTREGDPDPEPDGVPADSKQRELAERGRAASTSDGDSDRNNNPEGSGKEPDEIEEYDRDDYELATNVLEAAGWDPDATADRVEHHRKTGTLDNLLDRLERHAPEAWAKVAPREMDRVEDEPVDGLPA